MMTMQPLAHAREDRGNNCSGPE